MHGADWIILDTETNGLVPPIHAIEVGAQRMNGWDRDGPPFRVLLDHGIDIAPLVARLHGYTREVLERDGDDPHIAHAALRDYVADRPVASYNLPFDFDQVLLPEWARLGIAPIGRRGICMYRLAQRLLDPLPTANCKLQTLRGYYKLPERQAHSALGDVDTTIDLLQRVLRPLAKTRGLETWEDISMFVEGEWFPSRLGFGKHKGRDVRDATRDPELRNWLERLAASSNERSASMGRWYLDYIERTEQQTHEAHAPFPPDDTIPAGPQLDETLSPGGGLVVFVDLDAARLRSLIGFARGRLAEIEAEYMSARSLASATSAALFRLVRQYYQKRDRLRLVVEYRRKFLDALLAQGEEEAEQAADEFVDAARGSDKAHEEAAQAASAKQPLDEQQKAEIQGLWKKLVRLFHPDRYAGDPKRQAMYERLTAAINDARDSGDIELLKEIAQDPDAFIARKGWGDLGIARAEDAENLRRLYESIEIAIVERLEALRSLRESPEYELAARCQALPDLLSQVAAEQIAALRSEIASLEAEAERLDAEIVHLTGKRSRVKS
jgi:DNA polymerase III epsilon subunit-like protein